MILMIITFRKSSKNVTLFLELFGKENIFGTYLRILLENLFLDVFFLFFLLGD